MKNPIINRRVATVKATGNRYLVQRLEFPKDGRPAIVHCWGEIVRARGLGTKHAPAKAFLLEAVVVEEVVWTQELVRQLWEQGARNEGRAVRYTRRGNGISYEV